MDNELSIAALIMSSLSLVVCVLILALSDNTRHKRLVKSWMNEVTAQFESLEEDMLRLKRRYNVMIAREKANNAERKPPAEEPSVDAHVTYDMLPGEQPHEWKARVRQLRAHGKLKDPS